MRQIKNIFLLFISIAFSTVLQAQPSTFEKTYGTSGPDKARSICQTYDGGYAITGLMQVGLSQQLILLKTNQSGDTLWSKIFTSNEGCDGWSVKETFDKGFIIGGYIWHPSFPQDVYLIKADSVGNLVWNTTLSNPSGLFALSVIQDFDSNYVACGYVSTYINPFALLYVCKLNSVGDTVWTKTFSSTQSVQGWYIENTNDGNYIVTAIKYSGTSNYNDVLLVKIDTSGNIIWQKLFGGIKNEYGLCVKPTMDNCYLISGYSTNISTLVTDALLIKADSSGNLIWLKTFPAIQWKAAWSFAELPNFEGYIVTGQENISGSDNDVYLLKTDTAGNQIWSNHIGHFNDEHGQTIILTTDGGFAVSGYTNSIGNGNYDLYLIKTDSSGNILTGIPEIMEIWQELKIYPNPSDGVFTLQTNLTENADIFVTNILGEKIYEQSRVLGTEKTEINLSSQPAGIYFLLLTKDSGNKVVKKIIKL